jgi:hypothetical protein
MANDAKDPLVSVYIAICLAEETMDIQYVQKAKAELLKIIAEKYGVENNGE